MGDHRLPRAADSAVLLLAVVAALVAFVSPATSQVLDARLWIPNGTVRTLAIDGDVLYLGGEFTQLLPPSGSDPAMLPLTRNGIAAIDLITGVPTAWSPSIDVAFIRKLAVGDGTIYVAGAFGSVGGKPRFHLAEVTKTTGEATDWSPAVNGPVRDLAITDSTVLIGGNFDRINGTLRSMVAELSRATALPTPWGEGGPRRYEQVMTICLHGNVLYCGSDFGYVFACDARTGATLPWTFAFDASFIWAISARDGVVYVGGDFEIPRYYLAGIDSVTAQLTAWHPQPRNELVRAIALAKDRIYVGGGFFGWEGYDKERRYLATVDYASGSLLGTDVAMSWDAGDAVYAIATDGRRVYAGGDFVTATHPTRRNLIGFEEDPSLNAEIGPKLGRGVIAASPNPIIRAGSIRFELATSASVFVGVYDIGGRQVMSLVDGEWLDAGAHDIPISSERLPPGLYFVRLQAGDTRETEQFVKLR